LPELRLGLSESAARTVAYEVFEKLGYGAVAVTLSADGALWAAAGTVSHVPAAQARAIDSTGAGDAFGAGLLAAWLAGADGPAAARNGVLVAASAVSRPGGRPPAGSLRSEA